jgi:TolA-binding protein
VDCEKFDRVVLDLLYDELDELTRAAAMRHVEHCARCGPIANGLRATREVGTLPLALPPRDLELKILQAERRVRARLPWRQRFGRAVSIVAGYAMRPQLSMAALLLLMIGSSLLVLRSHPSDRDQGRVKESGVQEIEGEAPAQVAGPARAQPVPAASALGFASPPRSFSASEPAPRPAVATPEAAKSKRGAASEPSDAYDQAMAAYRVGRFAEAERGFDGVAAMGGPNAASAALYSAQARRGAAGCAAAVPRFEQVASLFPGSTVGYEATWQAAECYRDLGQRDRAERGYRELAQTPGYEARARVALETLSQGTTAMARRQTAAKARAAAPAAAPPAQASTSE